MGPASAPPPGSPPPPASPPPADQRTAALRPPGPSNGADPLLVRPNAGTPVDAPEPTVPPADARPTGQPGNGIHANGANGAHVNGSNGCTAPQLRRFIKSRPYVPMHELRRRFAIEGADDDVTQVRLDGGSVYVGLPEREGSLLGELLRGGEIGYELSLDPRTPIVVGVYPMRPVPRS